jgi:hypothetical protein
MESKTKAKLYQYVTEFRLQKNGEEESDLTPPFGPVMVIPQEEAVRLGLADKGESFVIIGVEDLTAMSLSPPFRPVLMAPWSDRNVSSLSPPFNPVLSLPQDESGSAVIQNIQPDLEEQPRQIHDGRIKIPKP